MRTSNNISVIFMLLERILHISIISFFFINKLSIMIFVINNAFFYQYILIFVINKSYNKLIYFEHIFYTGSIENEK